MSEINGFNFTFTFGTGTSKYYFLRADQNGLLRSSITTGGNSGEKTISHQSTFGGSGIWHHVAVTYQDNGNGTSTSVLYIDGAEAGRNENMEANLDDVLDSTGNYIGRSAFNADAFLKGSVDDFCIYDRVLDSNEIGTVKAGGETTPRDGNIENGGDDFSVTPSQHGSEPIAAYTFQNADEPRKDVSGNGKNLTLYGKAATVADDDYGSTVLKLDGSNGTYAAFPQGMFDGRNELTIEFSAKSSSTSGNFFTFGIGSNNQRYLFGRLRGSAVYTVITTGSWSKEGKATVKTDTGVWHRYAYTVKPDKASGKSVITVYVDGEKSATFESAIKVADLGDDLLGYLGKSFYGNDGYFNGLFDDVNVYNYAKNVDEIPNSSEPVVEYTFDEDDTADADASITNAGWGGVSLNGKMVNDGATLEGTGKKALKLTGGDLGSSAPYLNVPNGMIKTGQQDLTVSVRMKWNGTGSCVYPFNLGSGTATRISYIVNCGNNRMEGAASSMGTIAASGKLSEADTWMNATMVFRDGESLTYYVDGEAVAATSVKDTANAQRAVAALFAGTSDSSGYIGKSFFGSDPYFGGEIDDFRVWNTALTSVQIKAQTDTRPSENQSVVQLPFTGGRGLMIIVVMGLLLALCVAMGLRGRLRSLEAGDHM